MADRTLIIDDDVDTLKLVGMMLQREGYKILAAASGAQGLQVAERELPDIILLDLMMPQMDGYEVARRLKANPETAGIPILVFTARSQIEDRIAGLEAGADAYLTKPVHPAELVAQVRSLLARARKRPRAPTEPTAAPAYVVGVISARGGSGVTSTALNLAAGLQTMAKGEVLLVELRPGQGSLGPDLDLSAPGNLAHLLSLPPAEITRSRVRDVLVAHPSGLKLLLSSVQPRDLALLGNTEQFQALAQRLSHMGQFVVYDLGAGLTAVSQNLAKSFCSELLIVAEPSRPSVAQARVLLEDLLDLGVDRQRLAYVINDRVRQDDALTPAQVVEELGEPPTATLGPAREVFAQALRAHTIPLLMEPDSPTRQAYLALAQQVFSRAPVPQ